MKQFRNLVALVLALVMVFSAVGFAFAEGEGGEGGEGGGAGTTPVVTSNGALTVDGKITITGLSNGDTVKLFKVLDWTANTGWTATTNFAALVAESGDNVSTGVKSYVANSATAALTADDVAKIATVAQGKNATDTQILTGSTYEYTAGTVAAAGMYVALVTPKDAGTVYNPIIVSADFSDNNDTNEIDSAQVIIGTAVAKKKTITLEKTEPKITNDVNDTYDFTIKTTIPVYSSAFTNQYFIVTDNLSEYLDIDGNITVSGVTGDVSSYISIDDDKHGFTINFPHAYVSALQAAQDITITYKAKLNVPVAELTNVKEENNEVTVKFPNNPNDLTGKSVTALKDGTREYTFTIDGKLFGNEDWETSELVKVGLNPDGTWAVAEYEQSNGHKSGALKGAKYGLYTTKDAATAAAADSSKENTGLYTNGLFTGFVTTDEHGLMEINGLDVGTYWLVELTAPDGYIRDQDVHKIEITADINGDEAGESGQEITEYYTVDANGNVTWSTTQTEGSTPYTYHVPVLNSYTVTVDGDKDGKVTSTYSMTLTGPSISTVTGPENSKDLPNTRGTELPSTGGIGTTIFYVAGIVLVLGAAAIIIARRKAEQE